MIFEVNKDLRKSYFSTLFSKNLEQWLVKEKEHNEKLVGRGSYREVFVVQLCDGFGKKTVAKKVTRPRGDQGRLSDDFVREFGILELLSRSTTTVDRLIRMLGVKINRNASGLWQTALYTDFKSGGNLADFLHRFGPTLIKEDLRGMCKDVLQMLQQLRACGILHRDFKSHNIVVSKDLSPLPYRLWQRNGIQAPNGHDWKTPHNCPRSCARSDLWLQNILLCD